MITQEAIQQHLDNIDVHFANNDHAAIFNEAKLLSEGTNGQYSYFYGACYLNGWGTETNLALAAHYLVMAANHRDTYNYACYLAGLAFYRQRKYPEAIEWLIKAEKEEVTDAPLFLADSCAGVALELWNKVRYYSIPSEFAEGVKMVKAHLFLAIEKYMVGADASPNIINNDLWLGFGRMALLLYNLSSSGVLDADELNGDSLMDMFDAGMHMIGAKWDMDAHNEIFGYSIEICDFMAERGAELVAEYFRAYLSLLESERHKSAEAFYRARWHMKRVGELRNQMDPLAANQVVIAMQDIDDKYRLVEHKYGNAVLGMMRNGRLPDLTVSYGQGKAPDPQSCQNFMQMLYHEQAMANAPQKAAPSGGKAGGFLKNLFKF